METLYAENCYNARKRPRRKVLVFSGINAGDDSVSSDSKGFVSYPSSTAEGFTIDEADYLVAKSVIWPGSMQGMTGMSEDEISMEVESLVKIREDDEERRVHELRIPNKIMNENLSRVAPLHSSIGELAHLTHLDLSCTEITSLPPTIGRLQNLQDLDLFRTKNLLKLPREIGNLSGLKKLNLFESGISSIPPSICRLRNLRVLLLSWLRNFSELPENIGDLVNLEVLHLIDAKMTTLPPSMWQLRNLKDLNLCWMDNLSKLPEEIGDLTSLNELNLTGTAITSLPPSIGRLQKLEGLYLSSTNIKLPEEIGNLVSLTTLYLLESDIASLPSSIGRLQNLTELNLYQTENLSELPEEIGSLTKLKELYMNESNVRSLPQKIGEMQNLCKLNLCHMEITSLPDSVGRLKNLMYMDLDGISELQKQDQSDKLLMLVQRCPLLGYLGEEMKLGRRKLNYALACNRSRSRTGFKPLDEKPVRMIQNLWPLMLANASHAFRGYPHPGWYGYCSKYSIERSDAIYQLLLDGRESFLAVLLQRNTNFVFTA